MASIPPPPPPPPPSNIPLPPPPPPMMDQHFQFSDDVRQTIRTACSNLETARQQRTELEAWEIFASSQLLHYQKQQQQPSNPRDNKNNNRQSSNNMTTTMVDIHSLPASVQEAWKALVRSATHPVDQLAAAETPLTSLENHTIIKKPDHNADESSSSAEWIQIPTGQQAVAVTTVCTANSFKRMAMMAQTIINHDQLSSSNNNNHSQKLSSSLDHSMPGAWLSYMDERLQEIRNYHAQHMHPTTIHSILQPHPQPLTTDLASHVIHWSQKLETEFRIPEVLGKYLDMQHIFENLIKDIPILINHSNNNQKDGSNNNNKNNPTSYQYVDFLEDLSKRGLGIMFPEDAKLHHGARRKYVRWCTELYEYLHSYMKRTMPLLDTDAEVLQPAHASFVEIWSRQGGNDHWKHKPAEATLANTIPDYYNRNKQNDNPNPIENPNDNSDPPENTRAATIPSINLNDFETAEELSRAIDGDKLKAELSLLGLKCGGTVLDRAKRLFLLKTQKLDDLPAKLFVQKRATTVTEASPDGDSTTWMPMKLERRIDIAYREAMIAALLDQVRPTLEATIRRLERRQTQTLKEREREMEEELYGSRTGGVAPRKNLNQGETADDSDEEDDAPVFYNPKNVPLDWDGKPIPYWLFKLHGLNHYYPCEICGGESYRGRRAFELHFAEQKHVAGMAALGIPNTKHFHGVTKIDDAQELWNSLQEKLTRDQFNGIKEEEFEDSHGNVLSRAAYEDLARQGLL